MYDEDFNEDLADAVREGSLTECPYINKIIHCDNNCKECDCCPDNQKGE